jgi:hypothetical protein
MMLPFIRAAPADNAFCISSFCSLPLTLPPDQSVASKFLFRPSGPAQQVGQPYVALASAKNIFLAKN